MTILRQLQILLRYRRRDALRFLNASSRVCRKSELGFPLQLARDVTVKRCRLAPWSYVARGTRLVDVEVGRYASIGPECLVGGLGLHPTRYFSTSPLAYSSTNPISVALGATGNHLGLVENARVRIAEDVWIGARCVIVDGVEIGRGAIIGANTVVTKNVPAYAVFYGSPPQVHRSRFALEVIAALEASAWWEKDPDKIDHRRMERVIGWEHTP